MSQSNLQLNDGGYTSPDFLANLFKKPLYTPISLSSIHSLSDQGTYKENCSSPLLDQTEHSSISKHQNRVYRSLSIMDDEKIQSKKYKIFFKTLLHGKIAEQELCQIWRELQMSISNPFEFDKLIEAAKAKRQSQMQQQLKQRKTKLSEKDKCIKIKEKQKIKSTEKVCALLQNNFRYLSPQKMTYSKQLQAKHRQSKSKLKPFFKKLIKNQLNSIKSMIFKNQLLIRQKAF